MTRKGTTMIPAAFEYHVPTSIGEATALLARLRDDAKVLSGGQSLLPMKKLRLAAPQHLIDINRIPGLAYIREADGVLKIGAPTPRRSIEQRGTTTPPTMCSSSPRYDTVKSAGAEQLVRGLDPRGVRP